MRNNKVHAFTQPVSILTSISIPVFLTPVLPLISVSTPGHNSDEQPHFSQSGLAQCKLLLYGALVKHYSVADRPPLLPQNMSDIYTAITDLLGKKFCSFLSLSQLHIVQLSVTLRL